jgi:hypothetical protein
MIQANVTIPHFNTYMTSSDMCASYIQGGYTSLLLGVDQDAPPKSLGNYVLMECQIMKTYEFSLLVHVLGVFMNFK